MLRSPDAHILAIGRCVCDHPFRRLAAACRADTFAIRAPVHNHLLARAENLRRGADGREGLGLRAGAVVGRVGMLARDVIDASVFRGIVPERK